MNKGVYFTEKAQKEFNKLPENIRLEFTALIRVLEEEGYLNLPDAKKLKGYRNLYEIRVRRSAAWRALYGYIQESSVLVVLIFRKKTNKTPKRFFLKKAQQILGRF